MSILPLFFVPLIVASPHNNSGPADTACHEKLNCIEIYEPLGASPDGFALLRYKHVACIQLHIEPGKRL